MKTSAAISFEEIFPSFVKRHSAIAVSGPRLRGLQLARTRRRNFGLSWDRYISFMVLYHTPLKMKEPLAEATCSKIMTEEKTSHTSDQ